MRTGLLMAMTFLLAAGAVRAFEAVGVVEALDANASILHIRANGQSYAPHIAPEVEVLGADGKPLAGRLQAAELKAGAEISVTIEREGGGPMVHSIRLGRQPRGGSGSPGTTDARASGQPSIGFKPLTEMTAGDRYKGEDGGLYGGGSNEPPAAHLAAARLATAAIAPLDADGKPSAEGKIGLVSISMSNATMEYSLFKRLADADPRKSPRVAVVDCAQGGQAMAQWVDPQGRPWIEADRRLAAANVGPRQVQVIWVKLANVRPTGELAEHGRKLQKDTQTVLQNAQARFPNLRIAYLGSRIYGGYAASPLNPEPYAYEGAFAVRGLIRAQIAGDPELACNAASGAARAPLLLWGPYFWADGTTPRAGDRLVWERADLGGDGTHPSESGRRKVADMLLKFFTEDPLARTWFMQPADSASAAAPRMPVPRP